MISMNYDSTTSSWKPWWWVRPDTYDEGYIHQFQPEHTLTKFTNSSRSTEFKRNPPMEHTQMIAKTAPISTRIVISYAMKWVIPLGVWRKVNGNWDNNMIRISQWRESHCRLALEEINKSKRAGLWQSQSEIQVGKLPIWVRS